jgi:hypothetical protein
LSETTDGQPRWWPFGKKEDDEAPNVIVLDAAEPEPQPMPTRRFSVERVMARLGDVAREDLATYKEMARLAIQGVSWEAIQLNHLNKFGRARPLADVITMIGRVREVIQALEIEQELNEEIAAANGNPK